MICRLKGDQIMVKPLYNEFTRLKDNRKHYTEVLTMFTKNQKENKTEPVKTKAKNNITELVFILDRSGSMAGLESDTVGGFNSLIEKQKKVDGKCYVSTVLFNQETYVLHDRVTLENIKPMTEKDFYVGGCTALLDAIGGAIHHIKNIHKYARIEDVPQNTMFVIMTDGMENMSKIYSSDKVKSMIEHEKSEYGWEFLFIGANIDAVETASHFGINYDRAVNYNADSEGTGIVYDTVAQTVCSLRACQSISDDWSENIIKDYTSRK